MCLKDLKFVLGRLENIVGKGENASYRYFLLSPKCFQKGSLYRVVKKSGLCGKEVKVSTNCLKKMGEIEHEPGVCKIG